MARRRPCSHEPRRRAAALLCALASFQALGAVAAAAAAIDHGRKGVHSGAGPSNASMPTAGPAAPVLNASASVTIDLTRRQPTSPLLYGIFFEEVWPRAI